MITCYEPNKAIVLTPDDEFELKLLRERAERESRDSVISNDINIYSSARVRFTDTARSAMRTLETLDRILKQIERSGH